MNIDSAGVLFASGYRLPAAPAFFFAFAFERFELFILKVPRLYRRLIPTRVDPSRVPLRILHLELDHRDSAKARAFVGQRLIVDFGCEILGLAIAGMIDPRPSVEDLRGSGSRPPTDSLEASCRKQREAV